MKSSEIESVIAELARVCDSRFGGNQGKMAEFIGYSPAQISGFIQGKELPGEQVARRLRLVLKGAEVEILQESNPPKPPPSASGIMLSLIVTPDEMRKFLELKACDAKPPSDDGTDPSKAAPAATAHLLKKAAAPTHRPSPKGSSEPS